MIPSSTLLDVSDFFVPHRILTSPVSIHAPTWGATNANANGGVVYAFQSTLPHGERRIGAAARRWYRRFNPRSHTGSDIDCPTARSSRLCFNPRSHMGSDWLIAKTLHFGSVSIHAPAWGATYGQYKISTLRSVSIHAPTWGATRTGCQVATP